MSLDVTESKNSIKNVNDDVNNVGFETSCLDPIARDAIASKNGVDIFCSNKSILIALHHSKF